MKNNEWLIDKGFLRTVNYPNELYVQLLFERVYDLLKELPFPVYSSYDPKGVQIYFTFLGDKKSFIIDENISRGDYITLIKRWASQFFPKYEIESEKEIPLNKNEIFKKVKEEKIPIDEAVDLTKTVIMKEFGYIDSIYLSEDFFRMNVYNDYDKKLSSEIRRANYKWRSFLSKFKDIKDMQKRKDFIYTNSEKFEMTDEWYKKIPYFRNYKTIEIHYTGKMMYNFFSINYLDLKYLSLEKISNLKYFWGKFLIHFENDEIKKLCIDYVYKKREEDGINEEDIQSSYWK